MGFVSSVAEGGVNNIFHLLIIGMPWHTHVNAGFPKLFLGDPHNKDDSALGSIVGSPYSGKLPHTYKTK